MIAVAEDFAPRVLALVAHMKDPSQPKPEFTEAEKPMVFQLLGQMAVMDPSIKEAVDQHNARQAQPKPKSFWDNVGQVVSDVGQVARKLPWETLVPPLLVYRLIVKS